MTVACNTPTKYRLPHSFEDLRTFVRYALVGGTGTTVNMAVLWVCVHAVGWPVILSSATATETAILFNFVGNDTFTFRGRTTRNGWAQRLLRFQSISLLTLTGTVATVTTLTAWWGMGWLMLANATAIAAMLVLNFVLNNAFTWARPLVAGEG